MSNGQLYDLYPNNISQAAQALAAGISLVMHQDSGSIKRSITVVFTFSAIFFHIIEVNVMVKNVQKCKLIHVKKKKTIIRASSVFKVGDT